MLEGMAVAQITGDRMEEIFEQGESCAIGRHAAKNKK